MPSYPTFNGGITAQLPVEYSHEFETVRNDQETGFRYSYAQRATARKRWRIEYSTLTDSEKGTLQTFWESVFGQWDTFDFVDPLTGSTFTARFAMESLDWTAPGPNQNAATVSIEQVTA